MFNKLTFKRKSHDPLIDDDLLEQPMSVAEAAEEYACAYDDVSFWTKCKRYAGSIGRSGLEKAFTLYYATEHKNCTFAHKTAIYGALGYLLTPIDAIPDLTPLLGYTDDIGMIGAALVAVGSCIDDGVKHQAKDRVGRLLGEGALDGVRAFEDCDMDEVLSIWLTASIKAHDFMAPDFWASQVEVMRDVYIPSAKVYVYEKQGKVVGFYALTSSTLAALFVAPDAQAKGVGKCLLSHAKAQQKALTLTVFAANEPSIGFYMSQGFKVASEQLNEHTGHREYVMAWASA